MVKGLPLGWVGVPQRIVLIVRSQRPRAVLEILEVAALPVLHHVGLAREAEHAALVLENNVAGGNVANGAEIKALLFGEGAAVQRALGEVSADSLVDLDDGEVAVLVLRRSVANL